MQKRLNRLYQRWLDWRILSRQAQMLNSEKRYLKLLLKKSTLHSGDDAINAPDVTARLRFAGYKGREAYSPEEKVNRAYYSFKESSFVRSFRAFMAFFRRYRVLSAIFSYASIIFSAVQAGTAFLFSSAFFILTLPFVALFSLAFAVPMGIRSKKYAKQIKNTSLPICVFMINGISHKELDGSYAYGFIKDTAKSKMCLVTTSSFRETLFRVKRIDENVYLCSGRFINHYRRSNGSTPTAAIIRL